MEFDIIDIPLSNEIIYIDDLLESRLKKNINLCKLYKLLYKCFKQDIFIITPKLISNNMDIQRNFAYDLLMILVDIKFFKKQINKTKSYKRAEFMLNVPATDFIKQKYIDICNTKLNIK